ncbi:protein NYNRIN-like [Diachasmimorpha longicaudata]|uniref:protein NYNRIN-like n=1 Tax=Diachasmimorpha longicaudata TaxID=58733 RepID=UPI0030B8A605
MIIGHIIRRSLDPGTREKWELKLGDSREIDIQPVGNRYVLVVTDYFTRWPEVIPVPNHQTSTVAEVLETHVFSRYGIPLEIHSDQGRNFESHIFQEVMTLLGVKKTRTTPLRPQSNGLVERLNRTILNYPTKFVADNQRDWDRWIPLFLLAYRSAKHQTTEYSQAMLMLGRERTLPLDLIRGSVPRDNSTINAIPEFITELRAKLNDVHDIVRNNLILKSQKMKSHYDHKARMLAYQVGEKVCLFYPRRTKGKSPKLQSDWDGPYTIRTKINDVVYRIGKLPRGKLKIVHVDRLVHYDD